MADRAYIISRTLEHKIAIAENNDLNALLVSLDVLKEILALLKEQEPVAPVLVGRMWECGKCHAPVGIFMDDQRDQFCRTCGKKVKWDD